MKLSQTAIEPIKFNNLNFFIKRDDLLHEDFSGNKARKLLYFLENDFKNITKLISFGSAQSNALYSMAVLCKLKNWQFDFYVDHIASFLKENPKGNYKEAIEQGANIIEDSSFDYSSFECSKNELIISEGGAVQEASYGIKVLANELEDWIKKQEKEYKVFLPSGTGTTALFLQKYLSCEVLTVPCVGDSTYLKKQFLDLEDEKYHPTILEPKKKYHFGKLYKEFYDVWKSLKTQTNIEFDLLYDPLGMITLQEYLKENDENIIYIHQGGLKGNITMLERYERKYKD
jgi:1-aminocyclopropane-1-carboxylate deaminase